MKTQNDSIAQHLKEKGSITPMQALRLFGCMRLSGRIYDLKQRGMNIATETVAVKTRTGVAYVAKYSLSKGKK